MPAEESPQIHLGLRKFRDEKHYDRILLLHRMNLQISILGTRKEKMNIAH
jgi:hypothetical protein